MTDCEYCRDCRLSINGYWVRRPKRHLSWLDIGDIVLRSLGVARLVVCTCACHGEVKQWI